MPAGPTTREMLAAVEAEIMGILTGPGQAYKHDDSSFTKAKLAELRAYRKQLRAELLREEHGYSGINQADHSRGGAHDTTSHLY